MWLQSIYLIVGLALIVKGGDWFVSASVRLAEFLRLPRIVIGSTLVSLATTTPELVVSLVSGAAGESGLAVGNAVGSCICNIGLILGTSAALRQITIQPSSVRMVFSAMVAAALLLIALTLDRKLSEQGAVVLIVVGAAYFIIDFLRHLQATPRSVVAVDATEISGPPVSNQGWLGSRTGTVVQFLAAGVIVVSGSRILVSAAMQLAAAMGIPSMIIGLTVVAVGTSLPELVTAITSARRNVSDLAVGNILGANVANLTFIVGSAGVLSPISFTRAAQLFNLPMLLGTMLLLFIVMRSGRKIARKEGFLLLGFYVVYVISLIALTLAGIL